MRWALSLSDSYLYSDSDLSNPDPQAWREEQTAQKCYRKKELRRVVSSGPIGRKSNDFHNQFSRKNTPNISGKIKSRHLFLPSFSSGTAHDRMSSQPSVWNSEFQIYLDYGVRFKDRVRLKQTVQISFFPMQYRSVSNPFNYLFVNFQNI